MATHKIMHFRKDCISCGACAAIAPDYWEMDEEGLARLKGSTEKEGHQELEVHTEEARAINKEAADCCPVNIIHLVPKDVSRRKEEEEEPLAP